VSSKTIWELLQSDQTLDDILDNIPDEFYDWVMGVYTDLTTRVTSKLKIRQWLTLRKSHKVSAVKSKQCTFNQNFEYPYLIFGLLDGKPIDEAVWKIIKPKYEQPFRKDIDA
jgi:RNA ligase